MSKRKDKEEVSQRPGQKRRVEAIPHDQVNAVDDLPAFSEGGVLEVIDNPPLSRTTQPPLSGVDAIMRAAALKQEPRPSAAAGASAPAPASGRAQEVIDDATKNLIEAAKEGNITKMKEALELGAVVNNLRGGHSSSLYYAVKNGHLEAVKLLVDQKANIAMLSRGTPLHIAAENGHLDIVRFLVVERGADIEAKTKSGDTALHCAARHGHLEVAACLVTEGHAKIEAKTNAGWRALHFAALEGHLEVLEWLVTKDANITATTSDGSTALALAVSNGRSEVGNYLTQIMASRAIVPTQVPRSVPAVVLAFRLQQSSLGTPASAASSTPHVSAMRSTTLPVSMLPAVAARPLPQQSRPIAAPPSGSAAAGAPVQAARTSTSLQKSTSNTEQEFRLFDAAMRGELENVRNELEKGVNIEATTQNGSTALHLAAGDGRLNVVQLLLRCKANIEATTQNGSTALHLAAGNGHLNVVQLLLCCKANIEARTTDGIGYTAFHCAARRGQLEVVQYFIEQAHVDVAVLTNSRRSAFELARFANHLKVANYLIIMGQQRAAGSASVVAVPAPASIVPASRLGAAASQTMQNSSLPPRPSAAAGAPALSSAPAVMPASRSWVESVSAERVDLLKPIRSHLTKDQEKKLKLLLIFGSEEKKARIRRDDK